MEDHVTIKGKRFWYLSCNVNKHSRPQRPAHWKNRYFLFWQKKCNVILLCLEKNGFYCKRPGQLRVFEAKNGKLPGILRFLLKILSEHFQFFATLILLSCEPHHCVCWICASKFRLPATWFKHLCFQIVLFLLVLSMVFYS